VEQSTVLEKARFPAHTGTNFYSDPEIFVFEDAIYVPGLNHFDNLMGVFTREGYLIPQAAFYHYSPSLLKGQPGWTDPVVAQSYPVIETAIFAGHIHDQYGHFITEFISRLWAIKDIRTTEKLLVRCARGLDEVFTFQWAIELFDLLGLTKDDFVCPDHPIQVRNLIVPAPAFAEQGYCYRRLAEYCHELGDRAMQKLEGKELLKNKNIYVSRSQLVCGTVKIDNELVLESHMRNLDFEIVYPEKLSVYEQIALFRNNNIVVGTVGSAFHTSIFTPAPRGVAFNMKSAVDANFLMMDGINEASIDYVQSDNFVDSEERDGNYYETKTIKNIEDFAIAVFSLVEKKRNLFFIPNMGKFPVSSHVDIKFYDVRSHDGLIVKLDPRTGKLSSAEDNFFKKVILSVISDGKNKKAYFVSGEENAINIHISHTSLSGLAVPVELIENEEGNYSFFIPENRHYICALPISHGGWLQGTSLEILPWEKFGLEEKINFSPTTGSQIARLYALIAAITQNNQPFNSDFYLNQMPEIFSNIMNMKNKMLFLSYSSCLIEG